MHPDGSRTVYTFDNAQHKAVATTTDPGGRLRETIRYELDDAGRFSSGEISGPDGRFRFKSRYKYDDAGRLLEETQSAQNGTLLHKIVYSTMHRANKPVIPCLTRRVNWWVAKTRRRVARRQRLKAGRKLPDKRDCLNTAKGYRFGRTI
jgi:hypothetical protein